MFKHVSLNIELYSDLSGVKQGESGSFALLHHISLTDIVLAERGRMLSGCMGIHVRIFKAKPTANGK